MLVYGEWVQEEVLAQVSHRQYVFTQKIYEVDPMLCSHCGEEIRMMALIDDPPIIEKILKHLHLWDYCSPGPVR